MTTAQQLIGDSAIHSTLCRTHWIIICGKGNTKTS